METWKKINDFPNYLISTNGQVKSLDHTIERQIKGTKCQITYKGKILKPNFNKHNGYLSFYLKGTNDKYYGVYVHRLVAETFIDNPLGKKEVNHKDGNKLNNDVSNLEWVTREENIRHAFDNELIKRENLSKSHDKYKIGIVRLLNGKVVDRFGSIKEASRKLGIYGHTIKYAALHSKSHIYKGYEYRVESYGKERIGD